MPRYSARVDGFLKKLRFGELSITFIAFALMALALFADVLSRELTGNGLFWARQIGVYANVVVAMIGLGLASASQSHLRPRFADSWLPKSWDPVLVRLQELLMAGFCLAFALVAWRVVAETRELQERSVILRTLIWPVQAIIPLAFSLAAVRHGMYAIFPDCRTTEADFEDSASEDQGSHVSEAEKS